MKSWEPIAAAAIIVVGAATLADAASCRAKHGSGCLTIPPTLNFTAVPEISKEIVGAEPDAPQPTKSVLEAPPITTYTGPLVAVSPLAHAPTVGFYWSLEPENGK